MALDDPAPRVVALGGGHGLAATLRALRSVTPHITAVVTVADDGGSSGRLRQELQAVPPGDLRMALGALAGDGAWPQLVQHRFGGDGPLAGHPVGNLLLVGLAEVLGGSITRALDTVRPVLGIDPRCRVLPMSEFALDIEADVEDDSQPRVGGPGAARPVTRTVRGQVAVATTTGRVAGVRLLPAAPRACPEAVAAVRAADWVVLGPGSLFTSVIPHLLVPELAEAITAGPARRAYVLNLLAQPGEAAGLSPQAHLDALQAAAPTLRLDAVLADRRAHGEDAAALERTVGRVVWAPLFDEPGRHDPGLLGAALRALLSPAAGTPGRDATAARAQVPTGAAGPAAAGRDRGDSGEARDPRCRP